MTAKDIIFTVIVIAVFAELIYLVYFVNTESFKCMASPLTYGVSHIKYNDVALTCECTTPGAPSYYFVTKNNVTFPV